MTKPAITTRASKGSALTWTEGDTNLENLRDATITVTDGTNSKAIDLNGTIQFTGGSNITTSVNSTTGEVTISSTAGGATTLDELSDVVVTAAATGDILQYNGTNWVDVAPSTLTVGTASVASAVTTTADNTTNAARYPLFSSSSVSANISPMTDVGFQYNPSTGVLSTSTFSGSFSGSLNGSVGATTPSTGAFTTLGASGTITASGLLSANNTVANSPKLTIGTGSLSSTAWTGLGIGLRATTATYTDTSSTGTIVQSHVHGFSASTLASTNAITVTDAALLYIANTPTAGTNTTITNGWALMTGGAIKATSTNTTTGVLSINYNPASTAGSAIQVNGKDSQGGTGYFDFLKVTNTTSGGTNQMKTFRMNSTGNFEIINSAYSNNIFTLTDAGALTVGGTTFPTSPGGNGQVLTANGTGGATWAAPSGGGSGTVTSVSGTGTVNGLSLSGTVTTSGSLTLGGTLDLSSPPAIGATAANTGKFTSLQFTNTIEPIYNIGTTGGTIAPNPANGSVQKITLNSALTINAFTSPVAGQSLTLFIYGGTAYTSITSTMKFAGGIKTLTATAGCIDVLTIYYDGSTYFASLGKGYA